MRLIAFIILCLSLSCCQSTGESNSNEAEKILNQCIDHHGGLKAWRNFNSSWTMISNSIHTEGEDEKITINLNVPKNKFSYTNARRNVHISFIDTLCTAQQPSGIKDAYSWTKNFYTYIWGLPMKLKDPGTIMSDSIGNSQFNGVSCHELYTTYTNETWTYYINTNTLKLEGIKFVMNNDSTKGEIVEFNGMSKNSGLHMPKELLWYDLSRKKIGVDKITL